MLRRILVPLIGVESERKSLTLAFRAARATGAHVDALMIRPDPNEALPYLGEGLTGGMIEDILESAKQRGEACAALARKLFDETAKAEGAKVVSVPGPGAEVTTRYLETTGAVGDAVAQAACVCDLVVASDVVIEPTIFEAALIDAGRPVLIAPKAELPATFAQNIFVAWRLSAEAGHAVSAALPFLKGAKSVKVATIEREGHGELDCADQVAALKDYLASHGVTPKTQIFDARGKQLSALVMETIAAEGADLLVMGGYGHSRLREFILGGVTRDVAGAAPIPVLMAH